MRYVAFIILTIQSVLVFAQNKEPGTYYVDASTLNVRIGPSTDSPVTNKLYRGNKVDVLEFSDGWARISKFYDGSLEGVSGQVARWVSADFLSGSKPEENAQSADMPKDSRIVFLPKAGQDGLNEREAQILYKGAIHFLDSGQCERVEYGSKSANRVNTYFIYCGGASNIFFTPADIPTL